MNAYYVIIEVDVLYTPRQTVSLFNIVNIFDLDNSVKLLKMYVADFRDSFFLK